MACAPIGMHSIGSFEYSPLDEGRLALLSVERGIILLLFSPNEYSRGPYALDVTIGITETSHELAGSSCESDCINGCSNIISAIRSI